MLRTKTCKRRDPEDKNRVRYGYTWEKIRRQVPDKMDGHPLYDRGWNGMVNDGGNG